MRKSRGQPRQNWNRTKKRQMVDLQRRLMLRGGLSLGGIAMLSGCKLQDGDRVDKVLWAMSRWNDRVQAWLFSGQRLAPTLPARSQMAPPFPFNAFYPDYNVPEIDLAGYRLEVAGKVEKKAPWTLEQLQRLPQQSQVTRLICIEGWSAIGQWGGVPLRTFLELVGADTSMPKLRWLQMRRPLLLQPRHGHRAASADPPGAGDVGGRRCRRSMATRCACGCQPNWGSKTPNISPRSSSATAIQAGIGRIRATTGSAAFSFARRCA